ncbi:MAG: tyrosine-type recombinase/integrase [Alphaproteobacteria bacterium]
MKLTKRSIDSFRYRGDGKSRDVRWDGALPGFGVRVYPEGRKAFVLSYRVNGRKRLYTIAPYGSLTLDKARENAGKLRGRIADGYDPVEARRSARHAATVAELCDRYLAEYAEGRKKPSSLRKDRSMIERFVKPALGSRKAGDVSHADVLGLHNGLRKTPYQANRFLALLSKLMNLAEQWGMRPDASNPCRHVERFKERKRERYLSAAELARLAAALAEAECAADALPPAVAAIRLLLFTGARLSEILTLKWAHVDFERACLRLPDSKTGSKVIHLNAPALAVLSAIERHEGNPYVIVGQKRGAHLVNIQQPWRAIRERAGLSDVRLHDLRHSFASVGAGAGLGLPMIGALLGHREAATTARYSHLAADPLKQANDAIGAWIEAAMKGESSGEVVELNGRKR